jgi:hypothetical protein
VQLVATPHWGRHERHEVEQPGHDPWIISDGHRAPHGIGDVRDDTVPTAPDLVAEQAEAAEPGHPDGALGDDSTLTSPVVADLGHLDDEATLGRHSHERGVEERATRATLNQRQERLVQLPAEAYDVVAGTEGDPIEVEARKGGKTGTHGLKGSGFGDIRLLRP